MQFEEVKDEDELEDSKPSGGFEELTDDEDFLQEINFDKNIQKESTTQSGEFDMAKYIANKFGQHTITTGDEDSQFEVGIDELTLPQQIKVHEEFLKAFYENEFAKKYSLTKTEQHIIDKLKNNEVQEVIAMLQGAVGTPNHNATPEEAYAWKLMQEGYEEDEIIEIIDKLSGTKAYEKTTSTALAEYNAYLDQLTTKAENIKQGVDPINIEQMIEDYEVALDEINTFEGFQVENEDKQRAFKAIMPNENGISALDEFLSAPEGKVKTALMITSYADMAKQVKALNNELIKLRENKQRQPAVINTKGYQQKQKVNIDDFLTPINKL